MSENTEYRGVTIKTGDLDVLEGGTLITTGDNSMLFQLADIEVAFSFSFDDETKGPGMKWQLDESGGEKRLAFTLINWGLTLNTNTTAPLMVGILDSRELWINIVISSSGTAAQKVVHYCWYLGRPVPNVGPASNTAISPR